MKHSQFPNNGILRINSYNIVNSRCDYFLALSILDVNIFLYWGFLASGGPNMRKYWLVEVGVL